MKRYAFFPLSIAAAAAPAFFDGNVLLQGSTPGAAQSGHLNVSGTAKAGFFNGNGAQLTNLNATSIDTGVITLTGSNPTYMIRGSNNSGSANASGMIGLANSPTGVTYGGWFESKSSSGRALFGYASGSTGATYGVYGVASGNGGRAMFGLANHTSGNTYGGWFQSNSPDGVGGYARNIAGGIGMRAESSGKALEVLGKSTFSGNAQFTGTFTGIGPRTAGIGTNELFGISSTVVGFTGMYVTSGSGGSPYYGYNNGIYDAFTFLDGSGTFHVNNGASDLKLGNLGNLIVTASFTSVGAALGITNHGSGSALAITHNNSTSTAAIGALTSNGKGSGILIQLTNSLNGARGLDVMQAGVGPGVFATSGGGNAVWGISSSLSAAGVIGDNPDGEGVIGRSSGGVGIGSVVGRSDGVGGYGVRGFATKDTSIGVLGQGGVSGGLNSIGVYGSNVETAGTGIGVFGKASGAGQFAVFANGDYGGTGLKSFVIDHPTDPANKILRHYCTEGSQPLNAYSGNATTDGKGYAWVTLPAYVEDVNRDFRYQLTVVSEGEDFVSAMVSKKVAGNRFQVRSSKPGVEISWRIEGVRNDKYSQSRDVKDEIDKPANWKGKYLMPELYQMGPDKGIFYLPPAGVPLASDQPVSAANSTRKGRTARH